MKGERMERVGVPQAPELEAFLFDTTTTALAPDPELIVLLTPDRFVDFLTDNRDAYCDDETEVLAAIERFAHHTKVEFVEPTTPEEELSNHTVRVETEVSTFIETRTPMHSLSMLTLKELEQLSEIYNPNNLLALAKDLSSEHGTSLSPVQGDMLFRYRSVLSQIESMQAEIRLAQYHEQLASGIGEVTVGHRTWAGDLHRYGHQADGRIDPREFRDFTSKVDHGGHTVVTVDGIPIDVSIKNTGVL